MRTLIFTDVNGPASAGLMAATLELAKRRSDIEIVGVVTSRPERLRLDRRRAARAFTRRLLVAATNRHVPFRTVVAPGIDLARLERRHGIPTLVPEGGDPNSPEFVERLRRLRPELALSYDCLSIFRKSLLDTFEQAVNYHAGTLPHYRGVMATSFSVLAGERESGFTFHRMTEKIDAGPILLEGVVPVGDATASEVGRRKLAIAIGRLPLVLDKIVAKDPGRPPIGAGSYFGVREWMALIRVDQPEDLTAAQLERRIRAFGCVHVRIGSVHYPVTRWREARADDRLIVRTVDQRLLAPHRFDGLPRALHSMAARWF